ncbi:MAG: sugar transferase [Deltaproteobacteria bacterium]|nr:sugar transferase [Deltaproteobacteria bacterium]
MLKENNKLIKNTLLVFDIGITAISFFMAYHLRASYWGHILGPLQATSAYLFVLYLVLPLWAVLLVFYGSYDSIRTKSFLSTTLPIIKTVLTGGVAIMTALYIFRLEVISRSFLILFMSVNGILLISLKGLIYSFSHHIRKKGYNYRTVVIVGTGPRAEEFAGLLNEHKEWGIKVLGFVDHEEHGTKKNNFKLDKIGHLNQLKQIITTLQIDEVIFVVPLSWLDKIEEQILNCERIGIKASIAADFYPHTIAKTTIENLQGWPLLAFNPTPHIDEAMAFKRAFDLAVSSILLLLSSPVFLASIIGIKLSSKGPVFFRQERCGLNGRRFNVLKFRTMVANADEIKKKFAHLNEMSGPVFKIKDDPRITGVGRFLRKYSLDELPQLINVLMGDMSLVGPRPPLPEEVEKYKLWQRRRLSVRPGITCSWQVNGRNKIGFDEWMKLDLEYIDRWSFSQDMKIILKTIPAVIKGTGV